MVGGDTERAAHFDLDPDLIPNVPEHRRELLAHRPGASVWRLHNLPQHAVGRDLEKTALHPDMIHGKGKTGTTASAWIFSSQSGGANQSSNIEPKKSNLRVEIPIHEDVEDHEMDRLEEWAALANRNSPIRSPQSPFKSQPQSPLTSIPWEYPGLFSPGSTLGSLPSPPPLSDMDSIPRGGSISRGSGSIPRIATAGGASATTSIPRSLASGDEEEIDDLLEWSKQLSWQDYCDNVLGEEDL